MAESVCMKALVHVYHPAHKKATRFVDEWYRGRVRASFAYARDAIWVALKGIDIAEGDRVLLPELICRDVLPAVKSLGARIGYYPVGPGLEPVGLERMGSARAILAVNYFGFPQDLSPFKRYCQQHGAIFIEDNAHGLFSKDAFGTWLGMRGDVGIFSFRKTIPVMNGAAMVVNNASLRERLPDSQEVGYSGATPLGWHAKQCIRRIAPLLGARGMLALIKAGRFVRDRLAFGTVHVPSGGVDEDIRPRLPYPGFWRDAARVEANREIGRRRALYELAEDLLRGRVEPLFGDLPEGVAPYGYPFLAEDEQLPEIAGLLGKRGLDFFSWPELPDEISANAPDWYGKIRVVQFLW